MRRPIPPRSIVKIKKLWPYARKHGFERGDVRRIGYYCPQDGLDVVWLVDANGEYNWTVDHDWLYDKFDVIEYSDENDLFGENRPKLSKWNIEEPGGVCRVKPKNALGD